MTAQRKTRQTFKEFLAELISNDSLTPKPVEQLEERKYFLIVCEGARTEPNYFNYFKNFLPKKMVETIEVNGIGDNTVNVVNSAIRQREEREHNTLLPKFDEVWAVFDKDDFPADRYNEAIDLAKRNNVKSGHSNQSFEFWYVLHFQLLSTALHRKDYIKILSRQLGFKYKKNDPEIVRILFTRCNVHQAIKWARQLERVHKGRTPSDSCPQTSVYKLVNELLKYCNKLDIGGSK